MKLLRRHDPSPLPAAARRRLMVVERGASLACRDDAEEFDETTALTQLAGETADELAERAVARMEQAGRAGRTFDSVLLAVHESGSGGARRAIGRGLAAHGAPTPSARDLVIVAPSKPSRELREDLLLLTDELLFGTERPLQVRVCFTADVEPEQRSGTFWCVPQREDEGAESA